MRPIQDIEPQWVFVNNELRRVSEFASLPPSQRPISFCPVCSNEVTLKLGAQRIYHYAHRPEDICAVTQPETALHYNTKFYLFKQLQLVSKLFVGIKCANGCNREKEHLWVEGWDSVELEYSMTSFRPDIALLKNGLVIGVLEIYVTHSVETEKQDFYADSNTPWIEIRGDENIYEGDQSWTSSKPLPYFRLSPKAESWTCDTCQHRQKREQERREYAEKNFEVIHAAKMVDYYYPSGKKYREVYYVMKKIQNGVWVRAWIKMESNEVIASENAPITEVSLSRLNLAVKERIKQKIQKHNALVDDFMEWRKWEKGNKFVARDTDRFPYHYVWDYQKQRWISSE